MKFTIFDRSGQKTKDTIEVSDDVFGVQPNEHCVYLAVKSELASLRQGTSSSKTRGEVHGSGKKPWRQKGTGRARIGSARNPSRVHGGTAFGPSPREYNLKVNKKVKRIARKSVLSDKAANNSIIVVDNLSFDTPKTKNVSEMLNSLKVLDKKINLLTNNFTDELFLSSRNLKNVSLIPADSASAYDLMDCDFIIFDTDGIQVINSQLSN